jgi:hypothetical protein
VVNRPFAPSSSTQQHPLERKNQETRLVHGSVQRGHSLGEPEKSVQPEGQKRKTLFEPQTTRREDTGSSTNELINYWLTNVMLGKVKPPNVILPFEPKVPPTVSKP